MQRKDLTYRCLLPGDDLPPIPVCKNHPHGLIKEMHIRIVTKNTCLHCDKREARLMQERINMLGRTFGKNRVDRAAMKRQLSMMGRG